MTCSNRRGDKEVYNRSKGTDKRMKLMTGRSAKDITKETTYCITE